MCVYQTYRSVKIICKTFNSINDALLWKVNNITGARRIQGQAAAFCCKRSAHIVHKALSITTVPSKSTFNNCLQSQIVVASNQIILYHYSSYNIRQITSFFSQKSLTGIGNQPFATNVRGKIFDLRATLLRMN